MLVAAPDQLQHKQHVCAGPRPAWLLGNLAEVSALGGPALAHAVYGRRYGPVWASYGGPMPLVFTDHPEYARRVLQVHAKSQPPVLVVSQPVLLRPAPSHALSLVQAGSGAMQSSGVRPALPSLLGGKDALFEAGNIMSAYGKKHASLRAAWQPMFFSGRHAGGNKGVHLHASKEPNTL